MRVRQPIRAVDAKSRRLRCLCGSSEKVERHHVGGRQHVAWLTVPLCLNHHARVTAALRHAGVDMRCTPDKRERLRRARRATLVFLWALEELEGTN